MTPGTATPDPVTPPRHATGGRASAVLGAAVAALVTSGCRNETNDFARYVPEPEAARAAVVATLDGWRKGDPPGAVAGPTRPPVYVVDKQRRPDQRLTSYEVLGEVAAENARGFAARLTFEGQEETPIVRYLVVGRDPLWVFRQEDYEMISHWMHAMKEPEDRAAGPPPTP